MKKYILLILALITSQPAFAVSSAIQSGANGCVGVGDTLLLQQASGHGSTATKIQRWTTVVTNTGSVNSFTYADSATNGMSITINANGVYCANSGANYSTTGRMGFSKNSNSLTTDIQSLNQALYVLKQGDSAASGVIIPISWCGPLVIGDIFRIQDQGGTLGNEANNKFDFTKIGCM